MDDQKSALQKANDLKKEILRLTKEMSEAYESFSPPKRLVILAISFFHPFLHHFASSCADVMRLFPFPAVHLSFLQYLSASSADLSLFLLHDCIVLKNTTVWTMLKKQHGVPPGL